jgi:hypothetical protein
VRLKNDEIERMSKENAELAAAFAQRGSVSVCSPHEAKPSSRDTFNVDMNVDLQAKMIEELIMKNNQLSDDLSA